MKSHRLFMKLMLPIMLLTTGAGVNGNAKASHIHVIHHHAQPRVHRSVQYKVQNRPAVVHQVQRRVHLLDHTNHHRDHKAWFRDGLSNRQLRARNWISWHESRNRWRAVSYGKRCIGYFQMDPRYLGYKNGHVNLNHKHQVRTADAYARNRYGDWTHAKGFWQIHHWY